MPVTPDEAGTEVWASAAWPTSVVAWMDEQLAAAGIERTGEVEQPHLRPWATVLTAPTAQGPVWLKATGPGTAFEVGLYELLNRVVGEYVLDPIATNTGRGWVLLPDGGPPLGDRVDGDELVDALAAIVARYGQMQRGLAAETDGLLTAGVSDMRAAVMPARLDEALEAVARHEDDLADVADRRAEFAGWCEQLAAMPGGASVDHNDLHPWNMLLSDLERPGEVKFYDWGDAVVAHPFASMLVALGSAQRQLGAGVDSPEIVRIRDAYLDVFSDLAPHAELVETLELACRVGKVARALTWNRAVEASDPDEIDPDFARAPLQCPRSLLDESYLGGA